MAKKKKRKKPTKSQRKINGKELFINALIDLIVGILLIIIGKYID